MPLNMNDLMAGVVAGEVAADIIPDNMWMDPYLAVYGKKPPPAKKKSNDEPPLELNIAAKKPDPFTKLKTVAEVVEARSQGQYITYHEKFLGGDIKKVCFSPVGQIGEADILHFLKKGLFLHNTTKVMLYAPVLYSQDGELSVSMWVGKSHDEWMAHVEDENNGVVKALQPIKYFLLEDGAYYV
jgi:hypothetical protein